MATLSASSNGTHTGHTYDDVYTQEEGIAGGALAAGGRLAHLTGCAVQ